MARNIEASVRAKLLSLAKKSNLNFNAIMVQYFQERFLYRLSISRLKDNFILKGALLFRVYNMTAARPTVDIDFLGVNTNNSKENLTKLVSEIASIECQDGVHFENKSITSETIKDNDDYQGVRVFCIAYLGKAKTRLHFDIGFGDTIVPNPTTLEFPVLLAEFPIPIITAYSPESAIAEKFEAIISLGIFTSRIKDFYDIYYMSQNYNFSSNILREAIVTTFRNRETSTDNKEQLYEDFKSDKNKHRQWKTFLNRINSNLILSFDECIEYIELFLNPILNNDLDGFVWDKNSMNWCR